MLNASHREKLAGEVLKASFEASTLQDLSEQILPLLESLFDSSLSILYQCNERGELVGIGGALEAHRVYNERYFPTDPMRHAIQRLNRSILHAARCPEWGKFLKLPAYHDHAKHYGVDDYVLLKLTEAVPFDLGMVGLLLARSRRQSSFGEKEGLLLARLLPPLEALVRRSARVESLLRGRSVLEGLSELDSRPKMALDLQGSVLWVSERAEKMTGLRAQGRRPVPEPLVRAARSLGDLALQGPAFNPPLPFVTFKGPKAEPFHWSLRLARTRSGEPFVIAEAELPDVSEPLAECAARFQLTTAETHVLGLLAKGLSDQKIGRRLFVSVGTVRTHVGRIFSKLAVQSRVQAALVAHGLKAETDAKDEEFS